jgi:hypothetical protein
VRDQGERMKRNPIIKMRTTKKITERRTNVTKIWPGFLEWEKNPQTKIRYKQETTNQDKQGTRQAQTTMSRPTSCGNHSITIVDRIRGA